MTSASSPILERAETALPVVFLPYQQRLSLAIVAHPVVVVEKSRRTGFTWAVAADAMMTASAERAAGGMDVLYMGYEKEMTREFIEYVANWAKQVQAAASEVEEFIFTDPEKPDADILAFRVRFASGFEVVALPSVARALRGKQGLVVLDEAAFHDDLDGVLKAAFALLIWGGKVVVISTHNGDTNPFNVLVQDVRAGRKPYHLQRLTFSEALAEGLYRRICLTTGKTWSPAGEAAWEAEIRGIYGDNADEELDVIPNPSTGSFIPAPLIEARMVDGIPVLRWECTKEFTMWAEHLRHAETQDWIDANLKPVLNRLDRETSHCFGNDVARTTDLWVFWPLAIGRDLVRRTPFILELRNVPFAQMRQILWYILDRMPRLRGGMMDATGLGMQFAEETMQKYGSTIVPVMLNEPWYRENMPAFKGAFEDAMITVPRDREVLGDLRMLKMVRGVARVPQATKAEDGKRRHGDAAIAGALAYASSRAEPEIYEYEAAGPAAVSATGWTDTAAERNWAEDHLPPGRSFLPDRRDGAFI